MKHPNSKTITTLAAAILAAATGARADALTDQLANSVKESTVNLSFRYRFEAVDDDSFKDDAWASTLRSRLTVTPKPIDGFGVLLEVDDVRHVGTNHTFNDTRNGNVDRPNVNDPLGTEVNQAYLRYTGFQGTDIILGRQRIERANQRFIGGAGWRQNEQTFDAATISHKFGDKFTTSYAWIGQVNRIYGPQDGTPSADFDSNTHLIDASYAFAPALTVSGYWYMMDLKNSDTSSNQTLGLRGTGAFQINDTWKVPYAAEFAHQTDYASNPVDYDANYYLLEVGIASANLGAKVGYEVLQGDDVAGKAFRTPLGSPHPFQGWADKFIATPNQGIEDLYVAVVGKAIGADLLVRFHDFNAETGSGNWGSEVDVSATWPLANHYAILLKGASYDADDYSSDTNKYWLMLSANF